MTTLDDITGDEQLAPLLKDDKREHLASLIVALFRHWDIAVPEQYGLLGIDARTTDAISENTICQKILENHLIIRRVGHLLSIHGALRTLYPRNREIVSQWVTHEHQRFQPTPLQFLLENGDAGLEHVRRYLELRVVG